jgi:hypothetical protein
MKRPASLRAFSRHRLPKRNLLISLTARRLESGDQFCLLLRFFRGLLRQVRQSILAAIFSSSSLAAHRDTTHLLDVNGEVTFRDMNSAVFANDFDQVKIFCRSSSQLTNNT